MQYGPSACFLFLAYKLQFYVTTSQTAVILQAFLHAVTVSYCSFFPEKQMKILHA